MPANVNIGNEHWSLLCQYLSASEKVLWADQPVPRFFTLFTAVYLIAGIFWTVLIYNFFVDRAEPGELQNIVYQLVALFFFSFGFCCMMMPVWEYRRTRRTIYALTSSRAIHIENRRKVKVHLYPFSTITQIRLVEQSDGIGDVAIVCGVRHEGLPPPFGGDPGFYHIENAEDVAHRFETLITAKKTADQLERAPILVSSGPQGSFIKRSTHIALSIIVFLGVIVIVFGTPAFLAWVTETSTAGFFFFIFLFFMIAQVRTMILAYQSSRWPTVKGMISESYVYSDEDSDRPRVKYRYTVDDKEYSNKVVTLKQRSDTQSLKNSETIVSNYPEGSSVTVYYHPEKPGYSVLEQGRGSGNWIGFGVMLFLLFASTIWVIATWEGIDSQMLSQKWSEVQQFAGSVITTTFKD